MSRALYALVLSIAVGMTSMAVAEQKTDELKKLVISYEKVSTALVKDDMKAAKKASEELGKAADAAKQDKLSKFLVEFNKAETLKDMRGKYKDVSKEVIKLVDKSDEYFVMTCPMAKADWVQTTKKISNPFMGKKMPACGMLKKQL